MVINRLEYRGPVWSPYKMKDIERITPYEEGVLPYNIATQQSEQMTAPGERNVAYF